MYNWGIERIFDMASDKSITIYETDLGLLEESEFDKVWNALGVLVRSRATRIAHDEKKAREQAAAEDAPAEKA